MKDTSCVDDTCEMRLYFGIPAEQDCQPDRIIKIGPRGGIVVEMV